MQGNSEDVFCKEEVLDLTGDSDDEFIKQEQINPHNLITGSNHVTIPSVSSGEENLSSSPMEETANSTDSSRIRSIRRFEKSLDKAIAVIRKGGSLDAMALQYGIPKDVIYDKLISRNLPKETDILTSAEEFNLVQWILRANKNNTLVLKNKLLDKVGKIKKVADLTPIFAKSKFGKMWYEHFMRRNPEIYENDGILMPSGIDLKSSAHTSTSNQSMSKTLTDSEENKIVEWILEMNHQNKLVFKQDLLEKVWRLLNLTPMFVKSHGRKWYKQFLNNHPEIYENEELLMPSTSTNPVNNSSEQKNHSPSEQFSRGPLKIKKDCTKQLHILGVKEALVVLHDFRLEKKCVQSLPKKELRPVLSDTKGTCISEVSSRSTVRQIKFNHEEIACDIKSEKGISSEESVIEGENLIYQNERKLTNTEESSGSDIMACEKSLSNTENCRQYKEKKNCSKEADRPMCTKCNKTFFNKSKLMRHLTCHIPKEQHTFVCDVCFKRFPSKYHLSIHLKIAHSTNVHRCDECTCVFKHNTSLRKHKRTIHLDIKGGQIKPSTFICDICQKVFNYKKSLKDHIIYGHLQERKRYACCICRKRFIKYSLMLRHKLSHVQTKPFACNDCTKTFSRKYLLREHINQCKGKELPKEEDYEKLSINYLNMLDLD